MPQVVNRTGSYEDILGAGTSQGTSKTNEDLSQHMLQSLGVFYNSSRVTSFSIPLSTTGLEQTAKEALWDTQIEIYHLLATPIDEEDDTSWIPALDAVQRAYNWIIQLFFIASDTGLAWIKPHVTSNPDGEVVFEWWHGVKKMTIYVSEQSVDFVRVWGTDIHSRIDDGDAESTGVCRSLWIWLMG